MTVKALTSGMVAFNYLHISILRHIYVLFISNACADATWNPSSLTELTPLYSDAQKALRLGIKRQVWLSVSAQLNQTGWSCYVPRTSGPRLCVLQRDLLAGGEPTGSSPSHPLFPWNHRERFVTVGPALARSPHTMPASIYLYPVETEVFRLVSSKAGHTECTDAEWLFVWADHP